MKTKHFLLISAAAALCLALTACTSSREVTIEGQPGTTIYSPGMTQLATIPAEGRVRLKLSDEHYYAYLLSRRQEAEALVPFGLDYKQKSYAGTRTLSGVGYALAGAGAFCELVGVIAVLGGSDDVALPFVAAGSAGLVGGMSMVLPATMRLMQAAQSYRYCYLREQTTNHDLSLACPVDVAPARVLGGAPAADAEAATVDAEGGAPKAAGTAQAAVSGIYVGQGKLLSGSELIESYDGLRLRLRPAAEGAMSVEVTKADGTPVLPGAARYSLKADGRGYLLRHVTARLATIRIDAQGHLRYRHPRVEIEGEPYRLDITATRQ